MKLTFGQLETTLANHLHIHPDKVPTLRSRIKQLQRLQFPPGVNVGRGAKMEYSGEHLFMLVSAFELIGFGLPAQAACNLVNTHWNVLAGGYGLAALQARRPSEDEAQHVLAVLWVRSLHDIQFNPSWGDVEASSLKVADERAAIRELKSYKFDTNNTRLILSVGKVLERILNIAKERAGVDGASIYDDEFHGWLPQGEETGFDFADYYPDRSNLKMRTRLQQFYGSDPNSLTPEGAEEARAFVENDYSWIPF
ncbi:MAG: hypothetical protein QNI87_12050 [Erythrobacter sp.]|uniref:hypothetical protein n=1 Tax=Erythrobacter sp. TaxID=1042 RepID=UPI00262B2DA0|nr:hypothetical protein [Erythrobacter sp.]MDJ0979249.1 hypothetical protein [Erythrobacter sp.]